MKKKGFTLIELLAVIIILAVIALIATPIILNVVKDAKISAFKSTANGIIDAARYHNIDLLAKGEESLKEVDLTSDIIKYKGERIDKGYLYYDKDNQVRMYIYKNRMCVIKDYKDAIITFYEDVDEKECNLNSYSISGVLTEGYKYNNPEVVISKNGVEIKRENINKEEGSYLANDLLKGIYDIQFINEKSTTSIIKDVTLNNDISNLNSKIYLGDGNGDGIINDIDINGITDCHNIVNPTGVCKQYDINLDNHINADDLSIAKVYYSKVSTLIYYDKVITVKGHVKYYGKKVATVKIGEYTTETDEDGNFEFVDIPAGIYHLTISKSRHTSYENYFINLSQYIDDIAGELFVGDAISGVTIQDEQTGETISINSKNKIDSYDIEAIQKNIGQDSELILSRYDMNEDGVVDEEDVRIAKINVGKIGLIEIGKFSK